MRIVVVSGRLMQPTPSPKFAHISLSTDHRSKLAMRDATGWTSDQRASFAKKYHRAPVGRWRQPQASRRLVLESQVRQFHACHILSGPWMYTVYGSLTDQPSACAGGTHCALARPTQPAAADTAAGRRRRRSRRPPADLWRRESTWRTAQRARRRTRRGQWDVEACAAFNSLALAYRARARRPQTPGSGR